jgi:hypothetical protein
VESGQSLCRLQMDSGLMIQKYINFVVFKVDSTWTEWSPSGLHWSPGGVQPECVGECKVHKNAVTTKFCNGKMLTLQSFVV